MNPSAVARCFAIVALAALAACGGPAPVDGGPEAGRTDAVAHDAPADGVTGYDGGPCTHDPDCDDGLFCDGAERCIGNVCQAGTAPCDDHATCTTDACSEATRMCAHTPDDAMCGDMNACNGVEHCAPSSPGAVSGTGCQPVVAGNTVDCDDGNTCTIDNCDVAIGCVHAPRDLDGDGHVDRSCTVNGTPTGMQGDDCDDSDPTVYPGAPENCTNGRDDNCNMLVDFEDPACVPTNNTCPTATVLAGPGSYTGSTRSLRDDLTLSCDTGAYADAVFTFTLTAPHDVTVATNADTDGAALAILSSCAPLAETRCATGGDFGTPTIRAHSLPAGTYWIVAETGATASSFGLTLAIDAPTVVPVEDTCPTTGSAPAVDISDGAPHVAHLGMLSDDYTLSCTFASPGNDAVYRITLTAPSDVHFDASAPSGTTYVSFRASPCDSDVGELTCTDSGFDGSEALVTERSLAAGTYWVVVENDANADVTVTARVVTPPAPIIDYALSVHPAGVAFVDICAASAHREVLALADDANAQIPETTGTPLVTIPFALRFYGQVITPPLTVDSNGWLAMEPTASVDSFGFIPDPAAPNLTIAPLWDDLVLRSHGVCYGVTGTAPSRQFVVEWDDAWDNSDDMSTHLTFELIINEAAAGRDNVIDFAYSAVTNYSSFPEVGVENDDGSAGTIYDTDTPAASTTLRFTPSM